MRPSLQNLFMKKLTRERVVPIISASVSWLILAMIGSGCLPCRNSPATGAAGQDASRSNCFKVGHWKFKTGHLPETGSHQGGRSIIDNHRGKIWVSAAAVRGREFQFELPGAESGMRSPALAS